MYENEIQDQDMLISNLTFSPKYFIIRTNSPLPAPTGPLHNSISHAKHRQTPIGQLGCV